MTMSAKQGKPITILMADDDADDREMTREAFEESRVANDLRFVEDGVELLDYLYQRGKYADPATSPRPGLILLDVREPWEFATAQIAGSKPMPMGEIPSRAFEELDPEAHIVTISIQVVWTIDNGR